MNEKTYPLYKFACGLIGPHPGYTEKGSGLKGCPLCGARPVKRIFKCQYKKNGVGCGKEFEAGVRGGFPKYCKKCKKLAKRDTRTGSLGLRGMPRKSDCAHYDECMAPGGKLMRNPGACQDCPRYVYQGLDIMDYVTQRSTRMTRGRVLE